MLISQMIAKDPRFLKSEARKPIESVFDTKMKIFNAIKILVGNDVADFTKIIDINEESIFGKNLEDTEAQKRREMYSEYSRLPFPMIFIENETGGLLVEQRRVQKKEHAYDTIITCIQYDGLIDPIKILINTLDFKGDRNLPGSLIPGRVAWYANDSETEAFMKEMDIAAVLANREMSPEAKAFYTSQVIERMAGAFALLVYETLLFINVANKTLVKYKPTKKEIPGIPKNLLDSYEYRILDLHRSRKVYQSIGEVIDDISFPEADRLARRAHLVRGHFKRKNGKVFWWNPHMRNRKNLEEVGYVDKSYRLNDE
jgi:hypothetical protein